jgi:hypothetical protein
MHPEIGGDLLDRHPVFTVAGDPNNVVTELLGIRPCHSDILPARPPWASDLRCHLSVQQTQNCTDIYTFDKDSLAGTDVASACAGVPRSDNTIVLTKNG